MSDYKDFVGGLLNKAKDMASGTGITEVLEKGTMRAKNFGSATKTTLDLSRDHKELERVFAEIGKLYYEQAAAAPDGFFVPLFEQVAMLRESIAAKQAEIDAYKASFESSAEQKPDSLPEQDLDGRIGDFESIVAQTENDGSSL